jgi:AraC-like DNA-binding protein
MYGFVFDVADRVVYPVEARMERTANRPGDAPRYARHPSWVLDYSLTDGLECRTEFTDWMARPVGIAHLYPPGRRYMERYPAGRVASCCYIKFRGENANLRQAVENSGGFARIVDDGRLEALMKRAIRAAQPGNSSYYRCFAEFARIVELLEQLPPPSGADYQYHLSSDGGESLGRRVRACLERDFRRRVTIGALARELGCSSSTLSHRYRAECGESVFDTLLRIRVEQSMPMLMKHLPLKLVAEESGFNSEFYYSKVFKKCFGVSPVTYRKNAEAGISPPVRGF